MRRERQQINGQPGLNGSTGLAVLIYRNRVRLNYTIAGLAEKVGTSESFVRKVEKGERPITNPDTVNAFSDALGISSDQIYSIQGLPPPDVLQLLYDCANKNPKRIRWALGKIANDEMFDEELADAAKIAEKLRGPVIIPRKRTVAEEREWQKRQ